MSTLRSRPNLSDIAAALGVSVATVSNAMSGKGRVSTELIEKIRKTAAEIGYIPSFPGKALRTGRSGVLGLVLADIVHPLFPQIAQAVEFAAANCGYGVLIADSRGDTATQADAINRLLERGADGLVVVPRRGTRIGDIGRPVVVIDSPSTPGNTVAADHWNGGQQIARHLLSHGHRRFVIIGGSSTSNVQNDRVGGIRSSLPTDAASEVIWIEGIEQSKAKGCDLDLAAKARQGFTAFCAVSDLHALRALMELQRGGVAVPEEASVTGFDDLIWSPVVTPGLTTMRMDMATIAEIAIARLIDAIEAEGRGPDDDVASSEIHSSNISHDISAADVSSVPMQLVVRQSSGRAPVHQRSIQEE
ncbi:LacI family DNA-binding transcriptional regulator [Microvirga alba]|uniref:LacI family DNA-binding transcriptional regulator n=1 Tax=Microvirga alba TaxID=2791025 RepID=A0A931BIQ9_9HYPH|nr:LacI family DNA-binding transcriptional regulator [Microvirga alba]MBF9231931.1 LacI family DNA-binding transcriptional regulator [Microvirga alba]